MRWRWMSLPKKASKGDPKEDTKEDSFRWGAAINAYNRVLSADATASIDLVLKAANNLMRIYAEDEGVQVGNQKLERWGNTKRFPALGYQKLMEANTLAQYYKQVGFHEIQPLSADYEEFLKYGQVKVETAAVKKPDAGAEPDVEKAAEASEAE